MPLITWHSTPDESSVEIGIVSEESAFRLTDLPSAAKSRI